MKYLSRILVVNILLFSSTSAVSLAQKYPSYTYVFNEFDVEESYLYDEDFSDFVLGHEKNLKIFYTRSLLRGKEILPTMQGLLLDDGVSDLFIYLSMVESGFSADAVSPKKAVGLWQFMPATAKHYNLTICNGYDERCDTVSATSAAINYLNKLHKQFGKWYLAAMAYNCGEGCVEKAIERAGTDDLSVLVDGSLKYLPHETRQYIQKILLVAMIGENMNLGFGDSDSDSVSDDIENGLIQVDVVSGTLLSDIAELLKMKEKKLLMLNRGMKDGIVPKDKVAYKITIPIDKVFAFYLRYNLPEKKKSIKPSIKPHLISHYVALGDTLESIAKHYDTSVDEIKITNHLNDNFLALDSLLVIPVDKKLFENLSN